MRKIDFSSGMTGRAGEARNSKIPGGLARGIPALAGVALIATAVCLLSGCPTGPGSTTNPTPPTPTWSILDQTTRSSVNNLAPAGSLITAFITPGDDYLVTFHATSSSGIKNITLSGSGEVICHNDQPPFNEASPFKYTIPAQRITLSPQAGGQVFTEAPNFFFFYWAPQNGMPPATAPASTAFTQCRDQVPLFGTTTYTGQATTDSGVTNAPSNLAITTCRAGLATSPSTSCP
jgi:hypothetical protein